MPSDRAIHERLREEIGLASHGARVRGACGVARVTDAEVPAAVKTSVRQVVTYLERSATPMLVFNGHDQDEDKHRLIAYVPPNHADYAELEAFVQLYVDFLKRIRFFRSADTIAVQDITVLYTTGPCMPQPMHQDCKTDTSDGTTNYRKQTYVILIPVHHAFALVVSPSRWNHVQSNFVEPYEAPPFKDDDMTLKMFEEWEAALFPIICPHAGGCGIPTGARIHAVLRSSGQVETSPQEVHYNSWNNADVMQSCYNA